MPHSSSQFFADASSVNWDDLRFFLAASRSASLAEAARRLKVSAPTVGRRLRALEESLKVALFEPGAEPLAVTPAGQAPLAVAEQMEESAFALARLSDLQRAEAVEPVRITAIGSVALFLVRHFDAVRRLSDGTEIEIISTGERLSLARNEADIALRMGRLPRKGDLVSRKLGEIAYALYASEDFLRENTIESNEDLAHSTFIGYRKNPKVQSQSSWLYGFGAEGRFPLRVNELHLRFEAARQGLGITLLPCHLADREPSLRRLAAPPPDLIEEIYLLLHAERREARRIRQVSDALVRIFSDHSAELLG